MKAWPLPRWIQGQEVAEGERYPRFYGLAYRDPCRDRSRFWPWPLHLIIRVAWHGWWSLSCLPPSRRERREFEIFTAGRRQGQLDRVQRN